jgi:hypothetical protein
MTGGAAATTHGLAASREVAFARTRIDCAPAGRVTVARPFRSFFVRDRLAPLAVRYATRTLFAFDVALTWGLPVVDWVRVALRVARGLRVPAVTAVGGALACAIVGTAAASWAAPAGMDGMAKQADMRAATTAIRLRINIPVSREGSQQPS